MLRPKYLKKELQAADLCKNYLKENKNKGGIVNNISSSLAGFLLTFKDKFYAEREKRGKNIDATYLKNNFKTKLDNLKESIRVKFEKSKDLLKRCGIKINEPYMIDDCFWGIPKKINLSNVIKHIKKVRLEYFTRNKIFIDSEISSLFSSNNVYDYELIKKQYKEILRNLVREEYYLKRINKYLEDYEKKEGCKYVGYGCDDAKTKCYEYLDNKFKQIANIYAFSVSYDGYDNKDNYEDYYTYRDVDVLSDGEGYEHDYENYLYDDE